MEILTIVLLILLNVFLVLGICLLRGAIIFLRKYQKDFLNEWLTWQAFKADYQIKVEAEQYREKEKKLKSEETEEEQYMR